eukprot:170141_1
MDLRSRWYGDVENGPEEVSLLCQTSPRSSESDGLEIFRRKQFEMIRNIQVRVSSTESCTTSQPLSRIFTDFSADLPRLILSFMDVRELCSVSRTCRIFARFRTPVMCRLMRTRELCAAPLERLLKSGCLRNLRCVPWQIMEIADLLEVCPFLESLPRCVDVSQLVSMPFTYPNMRELRLIRMDSVGSAQIMHMCARFPNITKLHIVSLTPSRTATPLRLQTDPTQLAESPSIDVFSTMLEMWPNLRFLSIGETCRISHDSNRIRLVESIAKLNLLERLVLNDVDVKTFGMFAKRGFNNVKHLEICDLLCLEGDLELKSFAEPFKNLESFVVKSHSCSDQEVCSVLDQMFSGKSTTYTHMKKLTLPLDSDLSQTLSQHSWPNLKHLNFSVNSIDVSFEDTAQLAKHLNSVERLSIRGPWHAVNGLIGISSTELMSTPENLPNLTELRLSVVDCTDQPQEVSNRLATLESLEFRTNSYRGANARYRLDSQCFARLTRFSHISVERRRPPLGAFGYVDQLCTAEFPVLRSLTVKVNVAYVPIDVLQSIAQNLKYVEKLLISSYVRPWDRVLKNRLCFPNLRSLETGRQMCKFKRQELLDLRDSLLDVRSPMLI